MDRDPTVGDIVHVIHQQVCVAGMVVEVNSEGGAEIQEFRPSRLLRAMSPVLQPYVALKSARPTSGWHWRDEHE